MNKFLSSQQVEKDWWCRRHSEKRGNYWHSEGLTPLSLIIHDRSILLPGPDLERDCFREISVIALKSKMFRQQLNIEMNNSFGRETTKIILLMWPHAWQPEPLCLTGIKAARKSRFIFIPTNKYQILSMPRLWETVLLKNIPDQDVSSLHTFVLTGPHCVSFSALWAFVCFVQTVSMIFHHLLERRTWLSLVANSDLPPQDRTRRMKLSQRDSK